MEIEEKNSILHRQNFLIVNNKYVFVIIPTLDLGHQKITSFVYNISTHKIAI